MIGALLISAAIVASVFTLLAAVCEDQWLVKLLADYRIRRAVVTNHHDGEMRFQFFRTDWKGRNWCHSYGSVGYCLLLPGGMIGGQSYVMSWEPYKWKVVQSQGETKCSQTDHSF